MSTSSRYLAFVAYLLSLPGALVALLLRRDDPFIVYHARQSLAIVAAALVTPLLWAAVAWATAWIPLAGVVVGLTLFALVIATYIGLICKLGHRHDLCATGQGQAGPASGLLGRTPRRQSRAQSPTPSKILHQT